MSLIDDDDGNVIDDDNLRGNLLEDINVIVLGNNNTIAANIFRQQMRHQYHE